MNKNKEQVYISALAYVRNREGAIKSSLQQLWSLLEDNFEDFEIILIDDNSTDSSLQIIRDFAISKEQKRVTLISLNHKHGVESAMQVAADFSIGDFVIEIDDIYFNYNIDLLKALYHKCCEGYDIVSLQAVDKTHFCSRIFYRLLSHQHSFQLELGTQVAHCLTRRALNAISQFKNKTQYRKIQHSLCGYQHSTIQTKLFRKHHSSYGLSEQVNMASDILFYFTDIGMKICFYIAIFFLCLSLGGGLAALYIYSAYNQVAEGWTTLIIFMAFGFSGLFIVLGILSKYLSLTLREMSSVPNYTVKSIEKI